MKKSREDRDITTSETTRILNLRLWLKRKCRTLSLTMSTYIRNLAKKNTNTITPVNSIEIPSELAYGVKNVYRTPDETAASVVQSTYSPLPYLAGASLCCSLGFWSSPPCQKNSEYRLRKSVPRRISDVMTNVSRIDPKNMKKDPINGPVEAAADHVKLKILNDFLASVHAPLVIATSTDGQSVAQPTPSKSLATISMTGFETKMYEIETRESTRNASETKNFLARVRSESRPTTNGMNAYTAFAAPPTTPTSKTLAPRRYASSGRKTAYKGSTMFPVKDEKSSLPNSRGTVLELLEFKRLSINYPRQGGKDYRKSMPSVSACTQFGNGVLNAQSFKKLTSNHNSLPVKRVSPGRYASNLTNPKDQETKYRTETAETCKQINTQTIPAGCNEYQYCLTNWRRHNELSN